MIPRKKILILKFKSHGFLVAWFSRFFFFFFFSEDSTDLKSDKVAQLLILLMTIFLFFAKNIQYM